MPFHAIYTLHTLITFAGTLDLIVKSTSKFSSIIGDKNLFHDIDVYRVSHHERAFKSINLENWNTQFFWHNESLQNTDLQSANKTTPLYSILFIAIFAGVVNYYFHSLLF